MLAIKRSSLENCDIQWPFTVENGYLYRIGQSAIFETSEIKYLLNGIPCPGTEPVDSIWRTDPEIGEPVKVDLSFVIKHALKHPRE